MAERQVFMGCYNEIDCVFLVTKSFSFPQIRSILWVKTKKKYKKQNTNDLDCLNFFSKNAVRKTLSKGLGM